MIARRLLRALIAPGLALALSACTEAPAPVALSEGSLRGDEYHHPGFGWRMAVPRGWRALSEDEIDAINGKGRAMIEKSVGQPIVEAQVDLLYLRRTSTSTFTSSAQAHDEAADGPYGELQQALFDIVLQSYRDAGIQATHVQAREAVDGVEFDVLRITLLSPDGRQEIGRQWMYDALLGGRSLTVSVTSNLEADRNTMLAAWRASKFDRAAWGVPPATPP